ncbi:helix-turn-helix domain-containing protein [Lignipirellula cremea]|nr:XRE family transcriptional regulator [Lignipirellula cremea]
MGKKKSVNPAAFSSELESFSSPTEGKLEPLHEQICRRIRELRKKKNWTLEQLASLSGVSRSMLSQIERAHANPTLGVAFRIAQAFGMTLGELVETEQPPPRIDVIRAKDNTQLFRDDAQCRIRTLSPLHLEKDVEFYEVTLKPGGILKSAAHFDGTREFLTIEEGAARVTSGDESCDLGEGDSAHYRADIPHQIENLAAERTIAFLVEIYERN